MPEDCAWVSALLSKLCFAAFVESFVPDWIDHFGSYGIDIGLSDGNGGDDHGAEFTRLNNEIGTLCWGADSCFGVS